MDVPSPIEPEALLAETSMVRRLAQALVRRADLAHDVAQDVMLVALRQPQPPQQLRGWLAAVTRRLAGKAMAAQRLRARHEGDAAPPLATEAEQHTTERLQLHRRLTDAVLALPEPYRTTVTLRFFDELPPRAIAQRLGVSSEVVRKRLSRGLEMLRERLDGDFGDREQWLRAFAVVGLWPVGSPWFLLTVLAMNKLAVAAVATLAVGVFFLWPRADLPPVTEIAVAASSVVPAASDVVADVAAPDAGVQRRAVAAATEVVPECTLQLVDERGVAVAGASVHCWATGSEQSIERTTDRDGGCTFGALAGPGGVLVLADGRFPHHEQLAERRGEHRLVLPTGASIDGTLLVDGHPGSGWRVALPRLKFADYVPKPLQELFAWRGSRALCGTNGEFAFVGVPEGWQGMLELPQPLWLLSGALERDQGALAVAAPQHQLDLRATQLPTIRGRVLWSDTKEAVQLPQILGYAEFAGGEHSPSVSYQGNADGTFAIGFYDSHPSQRPKWLDASQRPAFRLAHLSITDASGAASVARELDQASLAALDELVVYLERPNVTHFRCVDADGEPIAGARVKARGTSEPTDADGRGTFSGTPSEVKLVGSAHHRIGPLEPRTPASGTIDDPLVFVLPNENVVRIRSGRAEAGQRCTVRSKVGAFAGGRSVDWFDQELHEQDMSGGSSGRTQADGSTEWYQYTVDLSTDAQGAVELHSLEPGVACDAIFPDDLGRDLVVQAFVAPPFGERLEVTAPLPAPEGPFVAAVVDEAGQPIVGAQAAFRTTAEPTLYAHRRANAEGRFELPNPGDLTQVELTLAARGFVSQSHRDLVAGAAPRTFVMRRGREILVNVVDEQDQPIDVTPGCATGNSERREWLRTGVWRWSDLPAGAITLYCSVGADRFELVHDTAEPVAILRVPRSGTLRIESPNGWPAVADARNALVAVLHCVAGGHKDMRIWRPERSDPEQLLPGTWHVELIEWSRPDRSLPAVERSLGLSAEVTVRAGEETTATLR